MGFGIAVEVRDGKRKLKWFSLDIVWCERTKVSSQSRFGCQRAKPNNSPQSGQRETLDLTNIFSQVMGRV